MAWMIAKEENTNYLCHHGIKGQKWGIRRYQNPDGSYTSAGRERYGHAYRQALDKNESSKKNEKNLSLKDFELKKDGFLECSKFKEEYIGIAEPERLQYKFGVSTKDAINRINSIRTNPDIIDKAKNACAENFHKNGGVHGVNKPLFKFGGVVIDRDNLAQLSYYLYDSDNPDKFQGYFLATLGDGDKIPAYIDYIR